MFSVGVLHETDDYHVTLEGTHHVEEHDDAEVDAHRCSRRRHLRIVADESPAEGGEGADGDHAVNDNAEYGGNDHQYL